jgi:hypothetical protein
MNRCPNEAMVAIVKDHPLEHDEPAANDTGLVEIRVYSAGAGVGGFGRPFETLVLGGQCFT